MGTLRTVSVTEQNVNTLAGVQIDTAVYAGLGTGAPVVRSGREAPMYVMAGTQTASNVNVILDLTNASHGATITVKRQVQVLTTAIISVVSGSAAGAECGRIGASAHGEVTAVFDALNQVWK
jgi:hypothetical protein